MTIAAVLVGLSSPYTNLDRDALLPWPKHAAGRRLMLLTGLEQHEYLNTYFRINLEFVTSDEHAEVHARRTLPELVGHLHRELPRATTLRLVGCGAEVRKVMGLERNYEWRTDSELLDRVPVWLIAVPHPSGRSRVLNNQGERRKTGTVLRQARLNASPVAECVAAARRFEYTWRAPVRGSRARPEPPGGA